MVQLPRSGLFLLFDNVHLVIETCIEGENDCVGILCLFYVFEGETLGNMLVLFSDN